MTGIALVLYGIYVGAVTYHENLPALLASLPEAKGYVLWAVVVLILAVAASIPDIEPIAVGLAVLIGLAYLLDKWPTILSQVESLGATFNLTGATAHA